MARLARIVAPNTPHHVTQRGNRRRRTFFSDADCLQLAAEWCAKAEVECWGYAQSCTPHPHAKERRRVARGDRAADRLGARPPARDGIASR